MADRKISDLTALTAPAAGDYLPIVDISEVAAASKNKRITIEELFRGVPLGTAAAPSIAIEGDENTGIYSPGADQLAISTNGTRRLDVVSTGQVRIGDGSVIGALSVQAATNANLHIRDINTLTAGTGVALDILNDAASAVNSLAVRGATTSFLNASSEVMRLTSTGRLGLGTSSPQDILHVKTDGNTGLEIGSAGAGLGSRIISYDRTAGVPKPQVIASETFSVQTSTTGGGLTSRLHVTSAGLVGIGTTALVQPFAVSNGGAAGLEVSTTGYNSGPGVVGYNRSSNAYTPLAFDSAYQTFYISGGERARIDSSGRLLVGTSTSVENVGGNLQVNGGSATINTFVANSAAYRLYFVKSRSGTFNGKAIVQSGDDLGRISFNGDDGVDYSSEAASIACQVDGTPGADDMPGRLVFSTTADGAASPTERMRITQQGRVGIGNDTTAAAEILQVSSRTAFGVEYCCISFVTTTSSAYHHRFFNGNGVVGSIETSGSSTSFVTSSDYRLKENVAAVTDSITRLKQLKPSRFNFIADPDKTVDGFLAHEVQAIVPEAVTGAKDAVDDGGNPIYQGIDQSKLVPLLTAALQEAIAEIASLKDRVAALEGA